MAVLALLMAGTSWAVASWVSVWLVPPYLILMALLLFPTAGRPQGDPGEADEEASNPLRPARSGEDLDDPDSPSDASASAGSAEDGSEQGTASGPTKARRGKARAKKARPIPEPMEATWVQVAPGKFVRVEASEGSSPAGPHSPVGVPVGPSTTPQPQESDGAGPLERPEGRRSDEAPQGAEADPRPEACLEGPDLAGGPIEDAGPAFDPVERPEGDPIGGVESGSSPALGGDETAGSPGIVEGTSAADGNTPQAGESFEEPEAAGPDVVLGAVDDRAGLEPEGGGWEVEDEPSSSTEDLEPTEWPTLADVPPEDADEWGATLEGTDPTETPVDETDLDDAGPFEDVEPHDPGASRDADPFETGALPEPSRGSPRWPWRLAPRAGTRVGPPPRAFDRQAPPRRPVRSHESSRRPPDPRRLTRRGFGRSRQITRTFPPRSPPGGRAGRGRPFSSQNQKSWI